MLEDFRHFDSLQLLELNGQELADLSGLEELPYLNTLNLTGCGIDELLTEVTKDDPHMLSNMEKSCIRPAPGNIHGGLYAK